jgi:hypothetical protein
MVTREQEERVIDLHFYHHKTYREIAKEVKISNRDSERIVNAEYDRREHGKSAAILSRAFALFRQGKQPMDVAIEFGMRTEVLELYKEYLNLNGPSILYKIYETMGGHLEPILTLCQAMIDAGMGSPEVISLLRFTNRSLPSAILKKEKLGRDISQLENHKRVLEESIEIRQKDLKEYNSKIQEKLLKLDELNQEAKNIGLIAEELKKDNTWRDRLIKTVHEEVLSIFSNSNSLFELVLNMLLQITIDHPVKFTEFIYSAGIEPAKKEQIMDALLEVETQNPYLTEFDRNEFCKSFLIEKAAELHGSLIKKVSDKFVDDFISGKGCNRYLPN